MPGAKTREAAIHLPISMARLRLYRRPGPRLQAEVRITRDDPRGSSSDIVVFDADGAPTFVIEGFTSRRLPARTVRDGKTAALLPYQESWHEEALEASDVGSRGTNARTTAAMSARATPIHSMLEST